MSQISKFYEGKNIFCTGGTGFMGKVLVEKLLRDCEGISKIYLLIRTKKGVTPQQRCEDYINHIVFDRIRTECPERLKKIIVIKGDVTCDNLGIDSSDEQELIDNCHIVFHCAANVRFDLSLKDAVNFNLLGTHRVLKLAEKMKNLQVFLHTSTAYCNCKEIVLEEKYYPATQNPFGIMEMVNLLSDETLELITPKLLDGLPNTYAFTKGLTEDLVHSFRHIPIVIARPSIVVAAWQEPMPGFVEGLNGPTGLCIGAAKGVIRSMHCNPSLPSESIPVDININCFISLAYKRSLMNTDEVYYCNITDSGQHTITWGESIEMGRKLFYKYPMSICLWYPGGSLKKNYYIHMLCVILFHWVPAYLIDFLLFLTGNKPFLVNVQKRVSQGLKVLQYYTTRHWIFVNDNFKKLCNELNEVDRKKFNCNITEIDFEEYLKNYILGMRKYILKEKPESLPKARSLLKRLYILDKVVSILFYVLVLYFIFNNIHAIFLFLEKLLTGKANFNPFIADIKKNVTQCIC